MLQKGSISGVRTIKILVADDELRLRKIVTLFLKKHGHDVVEVSTGEQALSAATHTVPDIIIMDINMPGMGGIEACRRLKTENLCKEIPLILLTANIDEKTKNEGFEAGAAAYMTKPFSPKGLLEKIKTVANTPKP